MSCSEIISIIDIVVSAGFGIWIATAIANGHTKERFLKDYFTNELSAIKGDCKALFDEICYDKKSSADIKIGFKILSMRISAFEDNLDAAFENVKPSLLQGLNRIQLDITNSEEFNDQFKDKYVKFSPIEKNNILDGRSKLLTQFSKAIIVINKARIKKK